MSVVIISVALSVADFMAVAAEHRAQGLREPHPEGADGRFAGGDGRMLDSARTLIFKEIAIARYQTEEQVRT